MKKDSSEGSYLQPSASGCLTGDLHSDLPARTEVSVLLYHRLGTLVNEGHEEMILIISGIRICSFASHLDLFVTPNQCLLSLVVIQTCGLFKSTFFALLWVFRVGDFAV